MKPKVFKRRQPKSEAVETALETKQCPVCPHKASEHNQFGCCYSEEVCPCLTPRAELENNDVE